VLTPTTRVRRRPVGGSRPQPLGSHRRQARQALVAVGRRPPSGRRRPRLVGRDHSCSVPDITCRASPRSLALEPTPAGYTENRLRRPKILPFHSGQPVNTCDQTDDRGQGGADVGRDGARELDQQQLLVKLAGGWDVQPRLGDERCRAMANERNIGPDPGQPMVYHATEYLWDTANAG
jgi:hypothetical protein